MAAFLILSFVTVCYAANFNTTGTGGNWASSGTWSGGGIPGSWGNHTVNLNHNVSLTNTTTSLNGFTAINLNAGRSFISGSSGTPNNLALQSVNFTIVNGVMTVYGNLTLNSGTNLVVTSGSLVVTGTLSLNGGTLTVANNQNVSVGNLVLTSSGGTSLTNNGNITVNSDASQSAPIINNGSISVNGNWSQGGSLTNSGNIIVNGNVSQSRPIINNNSGKIQVNGNHIMTSSSDATFTNFGQLNVTGNLEIPGGAKFRVRPGGKSYVDGNVTVTSNENLVVGTNVNPPAYADMVIKKDLISTGSGDILIERNGRLAVFGDMKANGGGSFLTINSGGQVYIDGDISMVGGGNHIDNNNTGAPYGLYTDGTVSYSGGGSNTQGHPEGSILDMYNESRPFHDWVAGLPGSPLPIELLYFRVTEVSSKSVELSWGTSFEKNFSHFQVERASADLRFRVLEEINGRGGMDINAVYTYSDILPMAGKNYYRLKCLDIDGEYKYSTVVATEFAATDRLSVYPNPIVNGSFSVQIGNIIPDAAQLHFMDVTGNVIITKTVSGNVEHIDLPEQTKAGFYYVRFTSADYIETIKVVIR